MVPQASKSQKNFMFVVKAVERSSGLVVECQPGFELYIKSTRIFKIDFHRQKLCSWLTLINVPLATVKGHCTAAAQSCMQ